MKSTLVENIILRLQDRHAGDIYVREALTGGGGSPRFDFWAMKPTWMDIQVAGYEVKISRSDFLQDKKWTGYLDFCTEFSFVCPHGLIRIDELPKGIGLLYVPKTGGHLYTKQKAAPREIKPENLNIMLLHVLMWRYDLNRGHGAGSPQQILRRLESNQELNGDIKRSIEKQVVTRVGDLQKRNEDLSQENENLRSIKNWAEENRVDLHGGRYRRIQEKLDKLKAALDKKKIEVSHDLIYSLEKMDRAVSSVREALEIKKKDDSD